MKKAGILFIIVVSLCWTAYVSNEQENKVSDLAFSNIEALAAGEGGNVACMGSGSLYCNGGYYKYEYSR